MNYKEKYIKYKTKYVNLLKEQKGGENLDKNCVDNSVKAHSQNGHNYKWLNSLNYGKVIKVEFEEPVDSGRWRTYDDKWWLVHSRVIKHRPENLVQAHMKAFINPGRFAKMMFYFEDGTIREPDQSFWELEANYFRENHLCE
ncbi:hypothetical protein Catovirus_1_665 [Catovirus CTV1]|uniref:Uncharacterized protein n=1 Tax=Catovirus CTV1 TaxID=1977631 RepID=A0A1V0SA64_9VIRU|nr:hypothetical protein Catovirus_1_665 [Catovirus CTV1]